MGPSFSFFERNRVAFFSEDPKSQSTPKQDFWSPSFRGASLLFWNAPSFWEVASFHNANSLSIPISFLAPTIHFIFSNINMDLMCQVLLAREPIMARVISLEESTGGCDVSQCRQILNTGVVSIISLIAFMFVGFVVLYSLYLRQLKRIKTQITEKTLNLFIMLTRALTIQLVFIGVMILAPLFMLALMFDTGDGYGSFYAQLAVFPTMWYTSVESLCLLCIVKPYRETTLALLGKCYTLLRKALRRNQVESEIAPAWASIGTNVNS